MKESQLSPLFTTCEGQGKPLLIIHGWGMNQRVWEPVRSQLAEHSRLTLIDLPGHGRSAGLPLGGLDALVDQLEPLLEPETIIMGWSLGGLVAQALAKAFPDKVDALIMVSSTPCFTRNELWQHGLPRDVLSGFAENLQKDYDATVKRFFALQFMGVRSNPAEIKALQKDILRYPADNLALQQGLDILSTADFVADMPEHPTLWLLGKLDKLIPVSLAAELIQMKALQHNGSQDASEVVVMPGAAHVPFVTHTSLFLDYVNAFIRAQR